MKPAKTTPPAPIPAGLGRPHRMDLASAQRTAAASQAAGFPVPAHIAELLEAVKATPAAPAKAAAPSAGADTDTKDPT
ncbi:hypothetical protein [Phenylobacterium sp. 58.2.17]|uniref:hypothetical protein n=1 Tax=Phenylobacterium sp. 58.2.17 TaxID=2969306 RepID=UPI0022648B6F|nr:hypothetical protein [Phenylobacterium sp. 58.2.17]MCX7586541.1 hypothetical protein [Phenylobacterium sp. 58.2.17]